MSGTGILQLCLFQAVAGDLSARFPGDNKTLKALDVVFPTAYRKVTDAEGAGKKVDDALKLLEETLGKELSLSDGTKVPPKISMAGLKRQTAQFKEVVNRWCGQRKLKSHEAWLGLEANSVLIEDISEWYRLACLALTIPIGSVENERRFSLKNLVHTDLRNRLGNKHLNTCVRISAVGSEKEALASFPFEKAFMHWAGLKKRYAADEVTDGTVKLVPEPASAPGAPEKPAEADAGVSAPLSDAPVADLDFVSVE